MCVLYIILGQKGGSFVKVMFLQRFGCLYITLDILTTPTSTRFVDIWLTDIKQIPFFYCKASDYLHMSYKNKKQRSHLYIFKILTSTCHAFVTNNYGSKLPNLLTARENWHKNKTTKRDGRRKPNLLSLCQFTSLLFMSCFFFFFFLKKGISRGHLFPIKW